MNIKKHLSTKYFKSKEELAEEIGLSERMVRHKISELKYTVPIIYNSQTKGYRLPKADLSNLKYCDLVNELNLINHCISDIIARKRVFNRQLRTYIAYKKVIEKKIEEQTLIN